MTGQPGLVSTQLLDRTFQERVFHTSRTTNNSVHVLTGFARFFLVQQTEMAKIYQNSQKNNK
jgi:hypothetical protein